MGRFSVFIVEDNFLYTYFLNEVLKEEGHFNITTFDTAEKCLEALNEKPDVVVLDYMLPGGTTGLEVLKKIHTQKPKLPVIILSSQQDVQVASDLMEAGAYDYIEKKDEKAVEKLKEAIIRVSKIKKENYSVEYFWTRKVKSKTIFIVEDNPAYAKALQSFLHASFPDVKEVKIFPVGEVALMELDRKDPGIIIMDYFLDTKYYDAETGLQNIAQIKAQKPEANIILLSSQSDIHVATEATKTFHCHYVRKDDEAFHKVENYIKGVW